MKIVEMKKKILYVEDCPELREITLSEMSSWFPQTEVVATDSGNKAKIILAEGKDFDLIVTDYQMADGNGLELLKFCQEEGFSTPVIVFHGGSVGPEVFHLASKNCIAVILKPSHSDLREVLIKGLSDLTTI